MLSRKKNSLIFLVCILAGTSCGDDGRKLARQKGDLLFDSIEKGEGIEEFSEKYFPRGQTLTLLNDLKDKCELKKDEGKFINDFVRKGVGFREQIFLIYEYYLKCDSVRFVLTYSIGETLELSGFKVEPIEIVNPMRLQSK